MKKIKQSQLKIVIFTAFRNLRIRHRHVCVMSITSIPENIYNIFHNNILYFDMRKYTTYLDGLYVASALSHVLDHAHRLIAEHALLLKRETKNSYTEE